MTCTSCGEPTPAGARFCPSCGHQLVARPDERRVATVVFADLVGFTTFSESADPEQVKHLIDTCFERLAVDIERFGGRVDKIVGDAIIALFGAPVAHEDDAERAVRAAIGMQETLAALRLEHAVDLEMRIGVNTGEVLAGALRAGGDYTAMGDVVNTASRLQTAALPGQVLVGPSTFAATSSAIDYEDLGAIAVKGRDEPVEVWAARGVLGRPGQRRLRTRVPLVGRTAELSLLREIFSTAVSRRRSQRVLIVGEAGVGKRRLGIAAAGVARREFGATIVGGQCVPYGELNPWGPLADAVRHLCGVSQYDDAMTAGARVAEHLRQTVPDRDDPLEFARLTTGLVHVLGLREIAHDVDPTRAREDAQRSIGALFEAYAARGPLMLVVGDVQWADDLVLETIDRVLVRLRSLPFVALMSARPEIDERTDPNSVPTSLRLGLEPLDLEATHELVSSLIGTSVDSSVAAALHERSGGNPFFIEELVAALRESGADISGSARDTAAERLQLLPATLRGLVAARLDAIPSNDRQVLELASIVGLRGGRSEIVALLDHSLETIDATLTRLAERDLVDLIDAEFAFKSELIADVAYATITKAERAKRHAQLGLWLGEQPSTSTADIERVAHQLATAAELVAELGSVDGTPDDLRSRALAATIAAAEHAERTERWYRCHQLYDRAVRLGDDDREQHPVRLGRARASANRHNLDDARRDATAVLEFGLISGEPALAAEAQTVLGDIERRAGNLDAANLAFERAIEQWQALGDDVGTASSLRAWGMTKIFQGDLDGADSVTYQALDVFRRVHDRRGEAWALQNLAWVAFLRGDSQAAEGRLDESAANFRAIGDFGGLTWALGLLGWVRMQQGRLLEAEELTLPALQEARENGSAWAEGIAMILLAVVSMWTGRTRAAVDLALGARKHFEDLDDKWGQFQAAFPLMRGLLALGRIDEAYAIEPRVRELNAVIGDGVMAQVPEINASAMAAHLGEAERAFEHARFAADYPTGRLASIEPLIAMGLSLVQLGRPDEALVPLQSARELATQDSWLSAVAGPTMLARAACGDTEKVFHIADRVRALANGSYLDLLMVSYGVGLAQAQAADEAAARTELTGAVDAADGTESLLDQALARLALAHGLESLGADDAIAARAEATSRLEALGIRAAGWETAFRAAAFGPNRSSDKPRGKPGDR